MPMRAVPTRQLLIPVIAILSLLTLSSAAHAATFPFYEEPCGTATAACWANSDFDTGLTGYNDTKFFTLGLAPNSVSGDCVSKAPACHGGETYTSSNAPDDGTWCVNYNTSPQSNECSLSNGVWAWSVNNATSGQGVHIEGYLQTAVDFPFDTNAFGSSPVFALSANEIEHQSSTSGNTHGYLCAFFRDYNGNPLEDCEETWRSDGGSNDTETSGCLGHSWTLWTEFTASNPSSPYMTNQGSYATLNNVGQWANYAFTITRAQLSSAISYLNTNCGAALDGNLNDYKLLFWEAGGEGDGGANVNGNVQDIYASTSY